MSRTRRIAGRLWARRRAVLAFSVPFTVLSTFVLGPGVTAIGRWFLLRWGRPSIGNFEIASFLLTPLGMAAVWAVGAALLAMLYLELAGLLRVLGDPAASGGRALVSLFGASPHLLRVGLRQTLALMIVTAPFVAAIGLGLKGLWAGHDINALLVLKPAVFWYGVVGAGAALLVWGYLVLRLALRWVFVLPSLRDDHRLSPHQAFRLSRERTKGRALALTKAIGAWVAVLAAATWVLFTALHLASGWVLDALGPSTPLALPVTALLVAVHFLLGLAVSIVGMAGFAGLVESLHREIPLPFASAPAPSAPPEAEPALPIRTRWSIAATFLVLGGVSAVTSQRLAAGVRLEDRLEITAHRAGAISAPENTVAAIRRAIEDRAEWAEIDVQRTSDDAIVVLHDSDLVRIGGPRRRVRETSLAEIRTIDVGRALGRGFEGERVPTLEEVVQAAGDRIGLNIELKPAGSDDVAPLTDAVLGLLRRAPPSLRYRICSQSYESIRRAKQALPGLEIGFIAGASIGDLTRLGVDYLMVQRSVTTRSFVEEAHARGIRVHAWTINDPGALLPLLDVGVDNVITDAPGPMRARLEEIRALEAPERLLLHARTLLTE